MKKANEPIEIIGGGADFAAQFRSVANARDEDALGGVLAAAAMLPLMSGIAVTMLLQGEKQILVAEQGGNENRAREEKEHYAKQRERVSSAIANFEEIYSQVKTEHNACQAENVRMGFPGGLVLPEFNPDGTHK